MSVSGDQPTMPELKKQAYDWLVLLRADDIDEKQIYAFADWLSRDPRHSEAFAAAEDLFNDMAIAAGLNVSADMADREEIKPKPAVIKPRIEQPTKRNYKHRFSWIGISLALAASWLFAVIFVIPQHSHLLATYFSDFHTGTGEQREVSLNDGSRLLLNTDSAVSVSFDDDHRRIILHHGQVRFVVTKDQTRPFEVLSDDLSVRALGTVFEVSNLDTEETNVIVQEHAVLVQLQGAGHPAKPFIDQIEVQKGQKLHHLNGMALQKPEAVELAQATAWQHHELVINDRPLGELITELNRYRVGRIFVSGDELQDLRISGVFSLDNPDNTLNTLQAVLGLKQTRLSALWVVLHR